MARRRNLWGLAALCVLNACSGADSDSPTGNVQGDVPAGPSAAIMTTSGGSMGAGIAGSAGDPVQPMADPMGSSSAGVGGLGGDGTAPVAGTTAGTMAGGMADQDQNTPPTPDPSGPVDGDPAAPMVEIPGIPCGPPQVGFGGIPNAVKITDRDVTIAYPCAHEGAQVTFFLFLHGTLNEGLKIPFTMNAWPIHELVDSHNIIVAVPQAIGTQWGNGDNGQDLPHLYDVVNWVYDTFGEKFDIRSMWAQGGSWGAFYLQTAFACDPTFQDRLKGIQLVVGGGCPSCADRLSCMVMQQELEKGGGNPLDDAAKEMLTITANVEPYANLHGCSPKTGPTPLGNSLQWEWPACDPGWAHGYYLGPGQHADAWDPAVVLKTTDDIKATER